MESQYLELWGNTFLNAARGRKLIEDFSKLMEGDIWKIQDLSESISRFFGFDLFMQNIPAYMKTYLQATEEFQKSFMNCFSWMDYVPTRDYRALRHEYDELKRRSDQQEREIHQLQVALSERGSFQGSGMRMFEEMMTRQTEQFQNLMTSFSKMFAQGAEEPQTPEKKKGSPSRRKE